MLAAAQRRVERRRTMRATARTMGWAWVNPLRVRLDTPFRYFNGGPMQLHSLRDSCGAWEGMLGQLWVWVDIFVRVRWRRGGHTMRDPQPEFNGLYRGA